MKLFSIFLTLSFAFFSASFAEKSTPNIIVILADDMGYGDLGFTGSKHLRTPHLDQLAKSGAFCTQGYVTSPVCSPSRAGLLTGRDPRRFGYQGNLNKAHASYPTRPELLGLPPGEHTLGDHLREQGYATALIGKWHLGEGPGFHPNARGFDHFCGMIRGSHTYFPKPGKHAIERNGKPVTEFSNEYLTDFFTDEGLGWMERQESENADRPWFAFFSYNAPHGPLQATETDKALFSHIKDPKRQTYAAMMWALDRGVGRIVAWLKEHDESENTLVVFFSDNGGATGNASWNGPLSGVKGCLKEGGIRVPMIWSWPGVIPGASRYEEPASAVDLLPTFLAAAGRAEPLPLRAPLSHEDKRNFKKGIDRYGAYDGVNLLPGLTQTGRVAERTLFWRLQGQAAILSGEDKLIRLSHRPAQFFKPKSDLGEAHDLAPQGGDRMMDLFRQLGEWEASLPTAPLWNSSPFWRQESARHYDEWIVREEPK